jgi:hypothetical protein
LQRGATRPLQRHEIARLYEAVDLRPQQPPVEPRRPSAEPRKPSAKPRQPPAKPRKPPAKPRKAPAEPRKPLIEPRSAGRSRPASRGRVNRDRKA